MFASLRRIASRIAGLFSFRRDETEFDNELDAHLHMLAEENIRGGMSPAEARRQAHIRLGGSMQLRETNRNLRGLPILETLWQDLRYGLRMLRKSPGFTTVAILTLAVGIGANTAIFSIVDTVLLRPLPFQDPSRLISLHEGIPRMGYPKMGFSHPDFAVFAREQKSFDALGSFQSEHVAITGRGEPERISVSRVSASLFPMLGVQPVLGRSFTDEEDAPGHQLAILSYGIWQRHYGGDSGIIGQAIQLDRKPYVVVGVMPRDFQFPPVGLDDVGSPADIWIPMATTAQELQDWGGSYFTSVVGRLRPGVTLEQARNETKLVSERIIDSYPAAIANFARKGELSVTLSPFQDEVVGSVRPLLLVLMGAVALVLLIACANLATLLLSRAATRQREIAVRTALGASRFRLIRQMLTESLLLALGGGTLGFFLAFWARDLMLTLVPSSIPLPSHVPLNSGVLAFAIGISVLAAVLFGTIPAFQASAATMQSSLQESGRGSTVSRRRLSLQGFFVTAEFALALVLLMGAGLLIRSFAKLLETNLGFRPENVLTVSIPLPSTVYSHASQVENFYKDVLQRVSSLPGVQSASISNDLPLHGYEMVSISPEGSADFQEQRPQAVCQSWILGNYFQTMDIPLLEGRWFNPDDELNSQQVALVSLSTAKKFWPGQDAIGKRVRWGVNGPWDTVVGVVGDVNERSLDEPVMPHVYRPFSQVAGPFLEQDPFGDWHAMNLALRTKSDPAAMTSAVVAQAHSLDPDLPVTNIRTMTQVISSSVAGPRFNTILLGSFAGVALFLAAIGIYGVLAYAVAQQTHEIGIRMALGAQPDHVLRLVLYRGTRLALVGVGIGAVAAVILTRWLSSLLYAVSATDPATFVSVAIVLVLVALAACYIPARRAMRVDPMVALRYE